MAFHTKVITDESQVPPGYVPLSNWEKDKTNAKRLSDAHNDGRIPAVKLIRYASEARVGKVWVDEEQAMRFLAEINAARSPRADVQSVAAEKLAEMPQDSSLLEHAVDIRISLIRCVNFLGDIYDCIESVARATEATQRAVEEMATRPKTAQKELRATMSSNGFQN